MKKNLVVFERELKEKTDKNSAMKSKDTELIEEVLKQKIKLDEQQNTIFDSKTSQDEQAKIIKSLQKKNHKLITEIQQLFEENQKTKKDNENFANDNELM